MKMSTRWTNSGTWTKNTWSLRERRQRESSRATSSSSSSSRHHKLETLLKNKLLSRRWSRTTSRFPVITSREWVKSTRTYPFSATTMKLITIRTTSTTPTMLFSPEAKEEILPKQKCFSTEPSFWNFSLKSSKGCRHWRRWAQRDRSSKRLC